MAAQATQLNRLCVFCGSSNGRQAEYRDGAQALARVLVKRQIKLVFGGGSVGLMGEIARGVRCVL
jgi:predicted Rossmann-fold nucleotide-binding protein